MIQRIHKTYMLYGIHILFDEVFFQEYQEQVKQTASDSGF